MQLETPTSMAESALAKRGLKLGDYGLVLLDQEQLRALGVHAVAGIGIVYPDGPGVANVRKLGPEVPENFKYHMLPGNHGVFYLGSKISATRMVITEGEFKAIAIWEAMGKPSDCLVLGINGVDSFSGRKESCRFHSALRELLRGVKHVTVIFDYDYKERMGENLTPHGFQGFFKEPVWHAEEKLIGGLLGLDKEVERVRIGKYLFNFGHDGPKKKFAVDDYLSNGGLMSQLFAEATKILLPETLHAAQSFALMRYGLLLERGAMIDLLTGVRTDRQGALLAWGGSLVRCVTTNHMDGELDAHGGLKYADAKKRDVNPLEKLGQSVYCIKPGRFLYDPQKPFGYNGGTDYNLWRGFGPSRPGDVTPWTNFCDIAFGEREREKEFFHQWVGYLLQNPGSKNSTHIMLYSIMNGTGKSTLMETAVKAFGPSGIICGTTELFGRWNIRLMGKSLIGSNELFDNTVATGNKVKCLVTDEFSIFEDKGTPIISVENIFNLISTSNKPGALKVLRDNRRDAVIKMPDWPSTEACDAMVKPAATLLYEWLAEEDGIEVIRDWYLNLDLQMYNPRARAPHFVGFEEAVEASMSWADEAADDIMLTFEKGKFYAFTKVELLLIISKVNVLKEAQESNILRKLKSLALPSHVIKINNKSVRCIIFGAGGEYYEPLIARQNAENYLLNIDNASKF